MISDHIENNIKQIKKERLYNITNLTDNILNYITDNNIIKGNILLSSHHILFLLYVLLIIILPINQLNIVLWVCLVIIHISVNIYFGKWHKCVLVKLERYFYNDDSWYGPMTPFYKLFNLNNRECNKYMETTNLLAWTLLFLYYFYRLYCYFIKKNEKSRD